MVFRTLNFHGRCYFKINRRLGGESNREIDFGFGSCVRARALDVESERASNLLIGPFPFPFSPLVNFLLVPLGSLGVQVNPSETKPDQVGPSETK